MGPEIHSICVDRQINSSSECYSLTMGCFLSYQKWVWLRIEARWILMQTHPCVSSFEDKRHRIRLFTKLCSKLYQNHNGSCQAKWMPDNWVVDRQLVKAVSLTFGCWSSSIRQYLICYLIFLCIILYLVEGSFQLNHGTCHIQILRTSSTKDSSTSISRSKSIEQLIDKGQDLPPLWEVPSMYVQVVYLCTSVHTLQTWRSDADWHLL